MVRFIRIVKGHYNAAIEHQSITNHKPTWLECIKVTIFDYIHNTTVEIDGAYVICHTSYKPHTGTVMSELVSVYVPIEKRGKGIASKLFDKVKIKPLITTNDVDLKYKNICGYSILREK